MSKQWDITRAPIRSEELRPVGMILRWITGAALIAYSIITTAIIVGWLLAPVITTTVYGIGVSYLIGLGLGIAVTVAEWATSHDAPGAHWLLVLLLDAPFTTWQTHEWLWSIADVRIESITTPMRVGLWIASLIWGVAAAKLGEKLLVRHT